MTLLTGPSSPQKTISPLPTGGSPAQAAERSRRFPKKATVWVAAGFLIVTAGLLLGGVYLLPQSPFDTAPQQQLLPPSFTHPAGTDLFGRDVFSRLAWGGRLSLGAGLAAVTLAVGIGSMLGLVSGYAGGRWDMLLMRIVDILLAFPSLLLALAIVAWLGPGLRSAALAVGLAGAPRFARLVRAGVLRIRHAGFVEGARMVGCRPGRILLRHILPHVSGIVIVLGSLELGYAFLNIGALGFLGLGAQPPTPEWGLMLSEGRAYLRQAPWLTAFPGLAITLSVLAVNLLGDALRDSMEARLHSL